MKTQGKNPHIADVVVIEGKTHISLTWWLLWENPHIADVAVIEGKPGGTHISLTWRLLSTVSMNERANQSAKCIDESVHWYEVTSKHQISYAVLSAHVR